MIKRTLYLLVAIVMTLAVFAGCNNAPKDPVTPDDPNPTAGTGTTDPTTPSQPPEEPVVVVFCQNSDPTNIDPHKVSGDHGANIYRNICEGLTDYNADWELEASLAESWERVADLEWVFYLKQGITFSDGEPFNADAVIYNLDRGASTEYPRQAMDYVSVYDYAEAVDEYTVKIVTKAPAELMDAFMADLRFISPKHAEEVGEEGSSRDVVGTGPYVLESWVPDQQITLQAREDYWGGTPRVDTYIIKTIPEAATMIAELINGNVDIVTSISFEYVGVLEGNQTAQTYNKLERRVLYIGYNTCDWSPNPELQDARVRQAMNYAIDRQAIIDNVMGGYGVKLGSFWRQDFPGYDETLEDYYTYDPDKARVLLAEAGYADGFTIKLQSHTGSTAKQHEISQAVAQYLADVGITCEVLTVEYNTMRGVIINGQAQELAEGLFSWSWAGKPGMIDSWLTGIMMSNGMSSYNQIPGYDELCQQILDTPLTVDRIPLIKELQKKLVEDPPYLYLFQIESIYGVSNRLDWTPDEHMYIEAFDMDVYR